MPTTTYTTFQGEILSDTQAGTVRDYVPDPLGSTVALLAASQSTTDSFSYWPYGEMRMRAGINPTPFTFVGTLGYFRDLRDKLTYVRARHYLPDCGRWLTVDPLWPNEDSYLYSNGSPQVYVDPSGRRFKCTPARCTPCTDKIKPGGLDKAAVDLLNCLRKANDRPAIEDCFRRFGGNIGDKTWEALKAYIACAVASQLARENGIGIAPGATLASLDSLPLTLSGVAIRIS
jgi:RHS repeat-associated protein